MTDPQSVYLIAKTLPIGFPCIICENPLDFEDICLGNGQCPCCDSPNSYGGQFAEVMDFDSFTETVIRFVVSTYIEKRDRLVEMLERDQVSSIMHKLVFVNKSFDEELKALLDVFDAERVKRAKFLGHFDWLKDGF